MKEMHRRILSWAIAASLACFGIFWGIAWYERVLLIIIAIMIVLIF